MSHSYSEDSLVEQPAIALFAELGWGVAGPITNTDSPDQRDAGLLGRNTKSEVVLTPRLRDALARLNPALPAEAITAAIDELVRDRSSMSMIAANQDVYQLLKDGVKVSVPDAERGGQKTERVRVVDWEQPENNDFLIVSQFSIAGDLYVCRPDLVGFVNGLPLLVIEFKKPGVSAHAAFEGNLTHYKDQVPALFWYNAVMIASNGTESRIGSLTANWERFFEWKRIEREGEPRRVSLEVMMRGTCEKSRMLDLVENFTLFSEQKSGLIKIVGQNHQFLGVNNAIASMLEARKLGHGRGGVFWQTQGSGKSFSMVFFAQKVLRRMPGNWTFVIVTDRIELDDQIAKTFKTTGAVSEKEGEASHAASGSDLRELLRGNHRYVFTLIHKFQSTEMLCDRSDVIVLSDEAHRSQYDTMALNMRAALPNATFLAFTGTPLIASEERTKEVFGDYVSVYDFQQSVEDGATVPLYYENRTPELQLVNPKLNDDIYDLVEAAELDQEQEVKLERELSQQYHLLTRDDRLETVAKDIVQHFLGRGFIGKAMVVSIDKATALKMYDKVQKHWSDETARVRQELDLLRYPPREIPLNAVEQERVSALGKRLHILLTTDMAVIVSAAQNEIPQMQAKGLDIAKHRRRMKDSLPLLDEKFKDTEDPLRLVFVCAMWLTGFDAPSCSTVYLDKPMRNHSLMQTIARANRVFPEKHNGVIVDYANVFASLEKALAIYGTAGGGENPVRDKAQLIEDLRTAVSEATTFCTKHGVDIAAIQHERIGGMERLRHIADAVDALISPDSVRTEFYGHERLVSTLYRAVLPSTAALEFVGGASCLTLLVAAIRERLGTGAIDISDVLGNINTLLDESIIGMQIRENGPPALDLSKIDFEALAHQFRKAKHKNTALEVLKAAIKKKLEQLIELNRMRTDYADKFEELIESYNTGSRNIEQLYSELLNLSRSLTEEEQRHVREQMTEEELVIFDILMRPAPDLSTAERTEVKKVARELLARLKELLVINWRQKSTARSQLKIAIEDVLDKGLPRAFTPELYKQKCSTVFEHVYESYPERNVGVYASGA